ncbi:MAG: diguanylate cyclase [Methylotenera sp.]|nr:diguanylate cyclase [Methylotenera sp.]MDD4924937.1 diguanylate cyclase [Methylotenera sp.]
MKIAPLPNNEAERLAALKKYDILDTEPDAALDAMVQLASYICQTPIAAISLIDENRQWFKAISGLDAKETHRDVAFCAHAILQDETMIVRDALEDERFFDNPLVTADPDIRFYAGVPLATVEGLHLGTLCVIDRVPRDLSQAQLDAINVLAKNIMAHLDLRASHKLAREHINDLQISAIIFDSASEAIVVTDADNLIVTVNPAFTNMTGYTYHDVVGKNPRLLSSGRQSKEFYQVMWQSLNITGHWDGELWNIRKNGQEYAEWLSINVIFNTDGSKRLYVAIFSDITEKKKADELIWKQANYDHLTQLPNRSLFRDRLEQEIKMSHRLSQSAALLFIDLDHFKAVNDTLGHDAGDVLLVQAAGRINQCVREADTVARMGGDEFTVILSQLSDTKHAGKVAQNIIEQLSQPFIIGGATLNISASIGIAFYPQNGKSVEQLLKNADKSMYAAKAAGRGRFNYFTADPVS